MDKAAEDAGRAGGLLTIIFLLGAPDTPVDGVEDYCSFLVSALREKGVNASAIRMPWKELGWLKGFLWLWRQAAEWCGGWVVVQYTALQWSNHALAVYLPLVFAILRLRGVRRAVVFHDANPYPVRKPFDRVRCAIQVFVMRWLCRRADRVITTIDPRAMPWLSGFREKCVCVPVGANIPVAKRVAAGAGSNPLRTVSVFSFTPGRRLETEAAAIAKIVTAASAGLPRVRLIALGRNSEPAGKILRKELDGNNVELVVMGIVAPREAAQALANSDVLLFVREGVSSRRGSAIAGIVQGLPVVAYAGPETGFPITEAGLALAPEWDVASMISRLKTLLHDDNSRLELQRRSLMARERYFSWEAVAESYQKTLRICD